MKQGPDLHNFLYMIESNVESLICSFSNSMSSVDSYEVLSFGLLILYLMKIRGIETEEMQSSQFDRFTAE